jgi:LysR family glycine cleavage system transcriptional activator
MPPLPALHAFEAAARLGSFAAAAVELHLSQSAVSQRVRALEAHLGVALFDRLPRSVRLTELGRAYLPAVQSALDDLTVATIGLFGSTTRRQLTVRVQISYAATWLAPRLQSFRDAYPHIDLRVVSAIWADALPAGEVDLEIRQGAGRWPGYRTSLLHDDLAIAVCGPHHIERYGPIGSLADLARRPRVHVLGFEDLWARLFAAADVTPSAGGVTLDTSVAAIELAAATAMAAVVPERFARSGLTAGRIIRASETLVPMHQSHYLLWPERVQPSSEALSFVSWVRDLDDADASRVGT